jgi:phosphohistidine phosphatase
VQSTRDRPEMKTLLLLRHAKSRWDQGESDHERGLNKRGERDAPGVGAWLRRQALIPDRVLCSSAARTRRTWDLVAGELPVEPVVETLAGLYLAPPGQMLDMIRAEPAQVEILMLVGHNPGTHDLAVALAGSGDEDAMAILEVKFPTCALAVVRFDVDAWSEVRPARGELVAFVRPRDR